MLNSAFAVSHARRFLSAITGHAIMLFARLVTAVRGDWAGVEPIPTQRVYFANHVSHGDFVLIWTTLPGRLRQRTRPVAGADYWLGSKLKKFIGEAVFRSVLIARESKTSSPSDAIERMSDALADGDSLIIFPEGTRNTTDERLLPFKSGLYHLAQANPKVELVPVWIDNLHRVLPKGEFIPVPVACKVTYGEPLQLIANEPKDQFIQRAQAALLQTGKPEVALSA